MQPYERLEQELAEWCGVPNVVACASGTAALHLALEGLQLPARSVVILPDFTMVACARAVTLAGLTPVFVDCDERLLMDMGLLACALDDWCRRRGPGGVVVMPVHVYGRRIDMDRLFALTAGRDVAVVEDLAECHGVRPHPNSAAACWSFYKNKIVAGEEGGAVAFRDPGRAALARSLRCLGFTDRHNFFHNPRGHNYRLANCLAEKILHVLDPQELAARGVIRRRLETICDDLCPAAWRMPPRAAPWVYDLRIPGMDEVTQDRSVRTLNENGVAARYGFKPMSCQPEYCGLETNLYTRDQQHPCHGRAAQAAQEVIYLPLTPREGAEEELENAFTLLKVMTEGL